MRAMRAKVAIAMTAWSTSWSEARAGGGARTLLPARNYVIDFVRVKRLKLRYAARLHSIRL